MKRTDSPYTAWLRPWFPASGGPEPAKQHRTSGTMAEMGLSMRAWKVLHRLGYIHGKLSLSELANKAATVPDFWFFQRGCGPTTAAELSAWLAAVTAKASAPEAAQ